MTRLLALILALAPTTAFGQCNGLFQPQTICGNETGANAPPHQVSTSVLTGIPGGSPGQIQYNNAGTSFGGFTASGDCTINTSTGVVTCTSLRANENFLRGSLSTLSGGL